MQKTVEVRFKDGQVSSITSPTSNATWICCCGHIDPLLCRSSSIQSGSEGFQIHCPECARKYLVKNKKEGRAGIISLTEQT